MQRPPFRRFVLVSAVVLAYVPRASSQTDWPTFGHDPQSTRFSPLKQVNLSNVSKLTRAWTFHMTPAVAAESTTSAASGGRGARRARGSEATPLVIGGVMYMPTPYN